MTRVYDDEEERFTSIFANSKKEDVIQNQYEFFVQRMGGRPLYSQRKGNHTLAYLQDLNERNSNLFSYISTFIFILVLEY